MYILLPSSRHPASSQCLCALCVCGPNSKDTQQHSCCKPTLIFVTCLQLNSVDISAAWYTQLWMKSLVQPCRMLVAQPQAHGCLPGCWCSTQLIQSSAAVYWPYRVCFCSLCLNFVYAVKNLYEGRRKLWKKDQHSFFFYVYLPSDSSCSV